MGQWFLVTGAAVALLFLVTAGLAVGSMQRTHKAMVTVLDVVDPAALRTLEISNALTAQEGSVRAYGRTNEAASLQDYRNAVAAEARALAALEWLLRRMPEAGAVRTEVARLGAAGQAWRRDYADRLIASVPTLGTEAANRRNAPVNAARFGEVRRTLTALQGHLNRLHNESSERLERGWRDLYLALGGVAAALVLAACRSSGARAGSSRPR